jgi:hypothetical protein
MEGTRSALIVASDDYTDTALRRLRAPATDAQALAGVLQDPGIGGFEVRTLLNEPAHVVNLAVEEFFTDRRPDDLLLMHFSCHGIKDEGGELHFAMADTLLRRLGSTAVAAEFVNRRMGRSRSRRIVLLLDCCYAGAFERGMTARAGGGVGLEAQFGGRGRAVITASSAMEYAFEGDELSDTGAVAPSVFTSALVEGLMSGEADRDQDGLVGLDELYDYVYDRVRMATPHQTPGKWTFGVEGELVIARRARPVTVPSPLPREVQEAIGSPLATVRAAAVQELARLLSGAHAGLALAAQLALEQLTHDDSRTVAAAATAVLTGQQESAPLHQADGGQVTVADTAAGAEHGKVTSPGRADGPASGHKPAQVEPTQPPTARAPAGAAATGIPAAETSTAERRTEPPTLGPATTGTPTGKPIPSHDRAGRNAVPQEGSSRMIVIAGLLAIAGVALLVVGLLLVLLALSASGGSNSRSEEVAYSLYVVIVSGFALAAAAFMLRPATRWLVGPGLLLGTSAGALFGLLFLLIARQYAPSRAALWLEFTGLLVLVLAACLAAVMLARNREVRLILPQRRDWLAWLVALLGAVGAFALVMYGLNVWHSASADRSYAWPSVWAAGAALVVPLCAAAAVPRRFGAALLAGWLGGAAAIIDLSYGLDNALIQGAGNGQLVFFGVTLLALLAVTILLARGAPRSNSGGPPAA